MILWLVLLFVVLWTVVYKFRRRNMYKLAAKIPEPKEAIPVLGIAHKLMGDTEDIMKSLQTFSYEAMEKDGLITGWLNHILYFILVDPVDLEMVLKTCMEKDDLHRFIRTVIGNGGIFAPVSIWKKRRKVLVPAFSPKIVESFIEVFSEQSEKLAKRLKVSADGKTFSLWPYIGTYTLDAVCETAMGVKFNAQEDPNCAFLKTLNRTLNLITERIFHLWLQPDWIYKHLPSGKAHQQCVDNLQGFTDQVIMRKREEIKAKKGDKSENTELDLENYKRQSFLDLLITLSGGEKGYTNIELREEVLTLAIAGTDTSAVCIGNTLKLLGKYPKIQKKVYQELYEVFGDTDRPLEKDDLLKLKYLERVVKESLRLFPPVPFIIRKVLEDTKLPSGRVLPGGSGIVVSIWGIHRDPKYWGPTAEHFDPDRFLPERFNLAHSCSFMPFSSGPRNCLGYQYAMKSIMTALSSVIRRFAVIGEEEKGPIPHMRVKLDIMMKAVDGYQIALEKRPPPSSDVIREYDTSRIGG